MCFSFETNFVKIEREREVTYECDKNRFANVKGKKRNEDRETER